MNISVQREDFDAGAEMRALSRDPKVGAVASFVGVVREVGMTLEHYPGMTDKALRKIVEEAKGRWKVLDCTVIHRTGELKPTDQIVLVAVASAHRGDAFAACEFIMDFLKTQAPFWKKEAAGWVEARASDDAAAERWTTAAAPTPSRRRR
ncbi:MAG: molybdenum cofactor biosynthesis protein MoaE [Betaproteobacteria bacterium]|nr:molybdenum cofactor biosynthesis protein MoaE [Betaproteobacteria bacterium]MDH4323325.1 molybdenum cofactor biosynthesis protein MoaE [Betaproteobacteria bacterium]MDH5211149.1 molybdenum cofactor biosynthesis protein MoaE [Betaproteobacteria bacterium]